MSYFYLIAGLALLTLCGDALVHGAVTLAVKLKIPAIIIGLTIVAFGTSAPELLIVVRSALEDLPGLALGNVIGSNIANMWLVLGVPALITALCCDQKYIGRNLTFMAFATAIFIALCFTGPLTLWHGIILLSLLGLFLIDCFARTRDHQKNGDYVDEGAAEIISEAKEHKSDSNQKIMALILVGLVGLVIGAELTIIGAVDIARAFGVSDATIGLTVVAVGTSLPELAATIMAAIRAHPALALGNAIGSNLFNILAVTGIAAIITPVKVDEVFLQFDLWVMAFATLAIIPFVFKRWKITRVVGLLFLLTYGAYIVKVVQLGRVNNVTQSYLTNNL